MPMFLCCPFCRSPTKFRSPENATLVINGEVVCNRPLCRERAVNLIQTKEKCTQLGLPFTPEVYQLPLRLNPG